jgi:hypothetical protein
MDHDTEGPWRDEGQGAELVGLAGPGQPGELDLAPAGAGVVKSLKPMMPGGGQGVDRVLGQRQGRGIEGEVDTRGLREVRPTERDLLGGVCSRGW